jgi:hypothetical protein
MTFAIVAITLGSWFAYSALKGIGLKEVLTGTGQESPLDPAGALTQGSQQDTTTDDGTPPASGGSSDSMTSEMSRMIARRQPYKWGGGHGKFDPNGPWDCSGAVSWILHHNNMLSGSPKTSTGLMAWGKAGRGTAFTVYANPTHTFIKMEQGTYAGRCWGTTSRSTSSGGSLQWHDHTTAGFVARHYEGS